MKANRSLERGLAILRAFARHPTPSLVELTEETGLARPTVLRFLNTLRDEGYVVRDSGNARRGGVQWRLTPRVLEFGFAALVSIGVTEAAQPILAGLAERGRGSSNLAQADGEDVVILARAVAPEERRRLVAMNLTIGSRLPRATSALGQAVDAPEGEYRVVRNDADGYNALAVPLILADGRRFSLGVSVAAKDFAPAALIETMLPSLVEAAAPLRQLLART